MTKVRTDAFMDKLCNLLLALSLTASALRINAQTVSNAPAKALDTTLSFEALTNRYRGSLETYADKSQPSPSPTIKVIATDTFLETNWMRWLAALPNPRQFPRWDYPIVVFGDTNVDVNWKPKYEQRSIADNYPFYMPTNLFCGPFEVRDSSGRKLHPLHPELTAPEAYPAAFSKKAARAAWVAVNGMGTRFPVPMLGCYHGLARFCLEDNFVIQKPGTYQLTVWPKIYQQSETDKDLCTRLDLAPVTLSIEVKEIGQKKRDQP